MEITIGADPEFFLKKDGKFVSAYNLVEGTKDNPKPVDGGAIQHDGMAVEFNINPAKSKKEFYSNIQTVLGQLRNHIPPEYEFYFGPVAEFGEEYIEQQPEDAKRLGCDPDFNAWLNGKENPTPDASLGFRTASGHIHIGWTNDMDINDPDHLEACCMLTKELDVTLGLIDVILSPDPKRRTLYGRAGAFRPKPYGLEYRVMSNTWLMNKWSIDLVYDTTINSFNRLVEGEAYSKIYLPKIINIINNCDVERAWGAITKLTNVNGSLINKYHQWENGRILNNNLIWAKKNA